MPPEFYRQCNASPFPLQRNGLQPLYGLTIIHGVAVAAKWAGHCGISASGLS
jgi:hypothetical protein